MSGQPMSEPGTYAVKASGETTTVAADYLDYDPESSDLRAWKDGKVVATFRWWDSVVRKGD